MGMRGGAVFHMRADGEKQKSRKQKAEMGAGNYVVIEFGRGEEFVAGFFDGVFHPKPIEQRVMGWMLAQWAGNFDAEAQRGKPQPKRKWPQKNAEIAKI